MCFLDVMYTAKYPLIDIKPISRIAFAEVWSAHSQIKNICLMTPVDI